MNRLDKEYLQKKYGIKNIFFQRYCYFLGTFFPKKLASILYKKQFVRKIKWRNPIDLNEKINWIAFNTDTSSWSILADKIRVRDYVIKKSFENILPRIYGVWENANHIEFEKLPKKFALKCNHDSGSVILVNNKLEIDKDSIKNILNENLSHTFGVITAEPHYKKIKKRIFAEEYIEHDNLILDYKFWCFRGRIEYCHVDIKESIRGRKETAIYDVKDWAFQKQSIKCIQRDEIKEIPRPPRLNDMLEIASTLANDFFQCRVDLYEAKGKIYFGELTFTSCCGRNSDYSDDFLIELGSKVKLNDG